MSPQADPDRPDAARRAPRRVLMLALMAWITPAASLAQPLMTWSDLTRAPAPKPSERIAYGSGSSQVVDLWLPAGPGPFPVVVMLHGGCWQADIATLQIMNYVAADLRRRGIAVWNIEYRGVDQAGGGYPGTFQDVAAATDALRAAAPKYHLKIDRVIAVGHSAGGHLAFWLAARPSLPASSPLHTPAPLPIAAAVSLGGLPDLEVDRAFTDAGCGSAPVDRLTGLASGRTGDVYADTSPAARLPLHVPQLMVQGARDPVSPPDVAAGYQAKAKAHGEHVRVIVVPDAGHAELIAPRSTAWAREASEIMRLARGS